MLSRELKRARAKLNWTQKQLSEITGIAQPVIARYELGSKPSARNLQKLSEALKIPISDLEEVTSIETTGMGFDEKDFRKKLRSINKLSVKSKMMIKVVLDRALDFQAIEDSAAKAS